MTVQELHSPPPGRTDSTKRRRSFPKGRQVDPTAVDGVRRLIGDGERRPDLLIEYLHLIQDNHGHVSARHLAALAACR